MYIKVCAFSSRSGHTMKICLYTLRLRFVHFRHKVTLHHWIDYRVFKRRSKMATERGSHISCLVRHVYRAMPEEVSCERSRVSGGNFSNVEEELLRNFQIPRLGTQQPPLVQSTSKLWKPW